MIVLDVVTLEVPNLLGTNTNEITTSYDSPGETGVPVLWLDVAARTPQTSSPWGGALWPRWDWLEEHTSDPCFPSTREGAERDELQKQMIADTGALVVIS